MLEGRDVCPRQVGDVHVVPDCRAIGRGVVGAEDGQPGLTAHGDRDDPGHEVVGAAGVLAMGAVGLRARRVEVAEGDVPEAACVQPRQHPLDQDLALAVRGRRPDRRILGDRARRDLAVHGTGRREDECADPGGCDRRQQGDAVADVPVEVAGGIDEGLRGRLSRGEVDDRLDALLPICTTSARSPVEPTIRVAPSTDSGCPCSSVSSTTGASPRLVSRRTVCDPI